MYPESEKYLKYFPMYLYLKVFVFNYILMYLIQYLLTCDILLV